MTGEREERGDGAPREGAEVRKFAAAGRAKGCPICGKPAVTDHRPFCSRRCADLDLGRWFRGSYRIPTAEPPDGTGDGIPDDGEDGPPEGAG